MRSNIFNENQNNCSDAINRVATSDIRCSATHCVVVRNELIVQNKVAQGVLSENQNIDC